MFLKKKGPIDVPGGLILLPMFAAHPYNHFCTEYPPGDEGVAVISHTFVIKLQHAKTGLRD